MSHTRFQSLHAEVAGHGPTTLVFTHGFGCDRHIWRGVAPALQADCRTLVYDHAGCGDSLAAWDADRHVNLDGYADDLLGLLDELGPEPVVGVGHSVGSVVLLLAALARPQRFSRLVLLAPSPCFLNDPPHYHGGFERRDIDELFELMESNHFGWAQFLAPMAMGADNPVALTRDFEQALCSLEPRIARQFGRLAFLVDIRDRLAAVQVPSLIVQCANDSLAPAAVGQWMHAQLPRSELAELPISGHCPHVSHPGLVIDLLRRVQGD